MKTLVVSSRLLVIVATVALAGPATAEIQIMTSDLQNAESVTGAGAERNLKEKKRLRALSTFEVKRAFGIAARERGRQAIEISCAPGDSQWCTDDFVAACDKNDGGMSTNPDGSVTCSMPQYE